MNKLFPYMIVALIVAATGPVAVDYIGGLTLDVAAVALEQAQ